jgi:hypothetical protein
MSRNGPGIRNSRLARIKRSTHTKARMERSENTMTSIARLLLVGACVATTAISLPARAQPPGDSNISFDAPGFLPKKPKPGAPDVRAQPLAWPRLDPGATLCRTQEDLEKLGARHRGEPVDGPIDCQIIRTATAISIVERDGPGRTEVKASDPRGQAIAGWTDAWLPDKGATGATSAAR